MVGLNLLGPSGTGRNVSSWIFRREDCRHFFSVWYRPAIERSLVEHVKVIGSFCVAGGN